MTIAPPSMFYTYRSSRLPLVYSRLESTGYQRLESVVMNHAFPPTPAPSLPSPSTMNDPKMSHFDTINVYPKHDSSSSSTFNPLTAPLPPTPPAEDPVDMQRLSIRDEVMPQRIRRGRTPVFDPDGFSPQRVLSEAHHISDNADQGQSSRQRLDVDLDAYANDFDDSREPTLSFHTSSTVESTTGTPSSMHGAYGFAHDGQGDKAPVEPRIRVRTTNGRSTAYSSAESSGAYSYHQYETNLFHPHPPPLPNRPHPFADPLGLGIRDGENPDVQAGHRPVTNTDFTYRPWEAEIVNRDRSTSSASLASFASRSSRGQSSSLQHYDYHYPEMLPWDTQRLMENEPEAVVMVEEGRERTLDMAKLEEMGGIAQMTEQKIAKLSGVTHLLLPNCGIELVDLLPAMLRILAPTLVVLDISHNSFTQLPLELRQCLSLEELNISSNPMRLISPFIGTLYSLRQLQMDQCTIHTLPSEMQDLANLHTLCLRRNRLVSLPSWLCHLAQLETLKVDENPFCREWAPVVAPILESSDLDAISAPYNPPRMSALSTQGIRAAASTSSIASSINSTPSVREMVASSSTDSVFMNSPISATPSMSHLSPLDAIAEDGPQSAPLAAPAPFTPTSSQSDMRRMRSAGSLFNKFNESDLATPTPPLRMVRAESEGMPLPPSSSSRLAKMTSSSSGSRINSPMEENRAATSTGLTASSSKTGGKWGFLRKMSMNRLRPNDKAAMMSEAATANIKLMPPALTHANTEPLHLLGRPAFRTASSAMTLPGSRALAIADMSEFGQSSRPATPTTLPASSPGLPNSSSMFGGFGKSKNPSRGKRRSFLPIDTPPTITLAIPEATPPMFTETQLENGCGLPSDDGHVQAQSRPQSSVQSARQSILLSDPPSQDYDYEREQRYATGLESIKSYLRDLYDLTRPAVDPYGSLEVVGTPETPASQMPNSPPATTCSAGARSSISEARRAGTSQAAGSVSERQASIASDGTGDTGGSSGSVVGRVEVPDGKKFKNDSAKRTKVLREIYETERTYVRGLGELVSIYVKPAGQPINPGKTQSETMIPSAERKIVFGGIESILTIHRDNLLPSLERAVKDLLENGDDESGNKSRDTAHTVGEVFRTYIAYMKQYSTYINNFDNAQSRMKTWSASSSSPFASGLGPSKSVMSGASTSIASAAIGASAAMPLPMSEAVPQTGCPMSSAQRKRVKAFLKRCRLHPMHSQINLESYLLLPIQRVPRYKLLLEDLAMCTPPRSTGPKDRDTLDDALHEISGLASLMNEEKREADSRLRLYHWQKRITGRGPSPLVQPHRKLILDGSLTLIRLVKKASTFVEVDHTIIRDGESTITPNKMVVPVEHIVPEPMDRKMVMILCSDMMVLGQPRNSEDPDCLIDLYNVLRMATVREAASIVNGNIIRLVDHKSIYYFNGVTDEDALKWCRAINSARKR